MEGNVMFMDQKNQYSEMSILSKAIWKVVAEPWKDTGILGLWKGRIQPKARDEAWSLRAFV